MRLRPGMFETNRHRTALRPILAWVLALALSAATARAVIDAPATPHARPGVAALLHVLEGLSGELILSGQQELGWDPTRAEEDIDYIKVHTGRSPVIRGLDYGDYLRDATAPTRYHATERAIAWDRLGGLVTFSCHMPMELGSPPGSPQFYSPGVHGNPGTTFDIRRAVIVDTPEYLELIRKMDVVAVELARLRDAGVIVIWRPFHECSGGWFWWGMHGPAPFQQAWRIMFERYTRVHGLDNLIWCYNPTDSATKMREWYPGDDVVDMIGLDVYPKPKSFFGLLPGRHPTFATDYHQMRAFCGGRKVVALTENGAIPDPDRLFAEGAGWAYFLTWNQFINDPSQNAESFVTRVYHHAKVITLDEFPAIRARFSESAAAR